MGDENFKTPDEAATSEMNKKIGKAIATRLMKIKKLQAEIEDLKSGKMVPDEDEKSSSYHKNEEKKQEKIREIIREIPVPIERERPRPIGPYIDPLPLEPRPFRPKPFWGEPSKRYWTRTWERSSNNNLCLC